MDLQTCVTSGTCAVRCPRQEPAPLSDHSLSHPSLLLGRWHPPQTPAPHTHTPNTLAEKQVECLIAETFTGILSRNSNVIYTALYTCKKNDDGNVAKFAEIFTCEYTRAIFTIHTHKHRYFPPTSASSSSCSMASILSMRSSMTALVGANTDI